MKYYTGVIIILYNSIINKFALVKNIPTMNITFIGGGREPENNSSLDTAKRELEEESGLKTKEYEIIPTNLVHDFTYNNKKSKRKGQISSSPIFFAKTKKEEIKPEDFGVEFLGWFSEDEIKERLTFKDMIILFEKVIKTYLNS